MPAVDSKAFAITAFVLGGLLLGPTADAQVPFTEEAAGRGLAVVPTPAAPYGAGVALADLDADGDLDALITTVGVGGLPQVFVNDGSGVFAQGPFLSVPLAANLTGVSIADFDGDADWDVFLTGYGVASRLLRNDGALQFTDVSVAAGVAETGLSTCSTWGDYDGDGWLDLYVCNYTGALFGGTINLTPNRLYRNLGDGTFAEVGAQQGVDDTFHSFQPVFFDADDDGDLDLYVANDRGTVQFGRRNRLFRNDGGSFVDVTETSGAGLYMDGMGADTGDFDRDGDFDIYVTNTFGGHALLLNNGDGTFIEAAASWGVTANWVGWGCTFLDFDHDTWEDLFVAHEFAPNHFYRNTGTPPAVESAALLGVVGGGPVPGSLGFHYCHAQGDIDGDGDLDLLVQRWNAPLLLYINHAGETRRWLGIRLEQPGPNHFAIGAVARVRTGSVTQQKQSRAGFGYRSSSDVRLDFGLDGSPDADEVLVRWPDGALSRRIDVSANQYLVISRAAVGTLEDCDRDFVPDVDEIAADPSLDADGDGWLDACPHRFVRGDANLDGSVDIGDAVSILAGLFAAGEIHCADAADANDDAALDIADAITLLGNLFGTGTWVPGGCGADPTPDPLGCGVPSPGC
jgi:hypothetical protein